MTAMNLSVMGGDEVTVAADWEKGASVKLYTQPRYSGELTRRITPFSTSLNANVLPAYTYPCEWSIL